ncbi:MAG: bifunctional alpha,alpha-trehalose-phosphate synthase (UDP-forming)/trehalose-phosphatase [Nitrospirota bacterium]|nr:bifunctional alpha,alpha-trehalose-phosphate synthase (UDP-forming)/trehalose-phosphatase [Nitrospirota bacterium]
MSGPEGPIPRDDGSKRMRIIVVSNREPYVHRKIAQSVKVDRPVGGLTAALDDVLRAAGGTWIAWGSGSADRTVVDDRSRVAVPPEQPAYQLKRLWLSSHEVEHYYHGYSNQVLWPLCHITLDRISYRKKHWDDYCRVNRAFADAVIEETDGSSLVWFQDYHLCLAPRMVRERDPRVTMAHFWHIPWPDWSVFRICPQARELLESLLANDLVGFQTPLFARNFMDCVRESLDADIDPGRKTVTYQGRTTHIRSFPISVDYRKFDAMASSQRASRMVRTLRERYGLKDVLVGIGVDRLEYTKALVKRFEAIGLFFERSARYRGKFTFIQIAVPTRMKEPYLSYKKIVEAMIRKINRKYGHGAWKPVIYISTKMDHEDLAAYYRLADLAIISSVNDGMNLVAKEYVASQTDGNGVLLLSELAGAAEELEGSLLVNPYNIEAFSDSIREALAMPLDEKEARMKSLRKQVGEHDIHAWVTSVLDAARSLDDIKRRESRPLFEFADEVQMRLGNRELFLFLDFDGTLAPIADSPDRVVFSSPMRSSLERVLGSAQLAVVSGRALDDLRHRIGIEGIVYAGNHGSEVLLDGSVLRAEGVDRSAGMLRVLLAGLRDALSTVPGVLIEDKGITASVHFRLVDPSLVGEVLRIFWDLARGYESSFRITTGKKVLEIRPRAAWDKGQAVGRIMELKGRSLMPIYVGDDTTDEDAFRAIRGCGISISIGPNAEADYFLRDQEEVGRFLDWLAQVLSLRQGQGQAPVAADPLARDVVDA